jgi:hypothetical protein
VLGIGSSGIQVIPNIQPKVAHLYSFIRSPTWVTALIAKNFLGSEGPSLKCRALTSYTHIVDADITATDTEEQKAEFRANPVKYQEYLKGLENEINSRFRSILQSTPEALEAKKVRSLDFIMVAYHWLTCGFRSPLSL